ncbi:MAG TPA: NAD+ synthase [Thermoplasmata archaeon]|nr:NAD+ synthase [Thermoplasmata archaeon]
MSGLEPRLPAHALGTILRFVRAHALAEGATGVVVGLSGGIDSALTARLARDALGAAHVLGVQLPDERFPAEIIAETDAFGRSLGIEVRTVPIDGAVRAIRELLPEIADRVTLGNEVARVRMTVLYALARERRRRVAGTGNKSELLLGYFTKYGDGGVDLLPIGDLYKTEVLALARELELPAAIRERPPSAGLWEGQTDEGELGLPYAEIDRILVGLEQLRDEGEIVERTGLSADVVRAIVQRVHASRHKRRPPPVAKVGLRTVGLDWRE